MKKLTIDDIGQEAGVSTATVSNVLNNKPYVSAVTRRKVMRVIERRQFTPSAAARNLSKRRMNTIGFIAPHHAGFFAQLLRGADEALQPRDVYLLAATCRDNARPFDVAQKIIREGRVDGILLCTPLLTDDEYAELRRYPVPVVVPDRRVSGPQMNCIKYDGIRGARLATQHLIEHGHERIACVTGPLEWESARDRLRGYEMALGDSGLILDPSLIVEGNYDDSTDKFVNHFRGKPWPDAIVCGNDWTALYLLRYTSNHREEKIRKTAIVGFDDVEPAAMAGLTTVSGHVEGLGKRLAEVLLELMEPGPETAASAPPREEILPVELVVRSSCGCVFSSIRPK
jgi:LacI family transcriptional regulator